MGKYEKLLAKILRGSSDANIAFEDLCQLLRRLGFEERVSGSHHNFRRAGVEAKAYQVKQVHTVLVDNKLVPEEAEDA